MKKFICVILIVMMLGCVIGCGNTNADVEKYDLTIIGGEDILKPLAPSYKAGRAVKFQLSRVDLYDPDITMIVCLDGVALKRDVTHIGMVAYYEYNFTMPAHDAVLTIEYIDTFYENTAGKKIEFDILSGDAHLNFDPDVFKEKRDIITTSEKWDRYIESVDKRAVEFLPDLADEFFDTDSLIIVSGSHYSYGNVLKKVKMVKTSTINEKFCLTVKINVMSGGFQSPTSGCILIKVKKEDVENCNLSVKIYPDYFWNNVFNAEK